MKDNFNIQFAAQDLLEDIEETSVSSGVGAYQARSGMGKDKYKKHPGERTTGGMIYKDLWEYEDSYLSTIIDDIRSHLATSSALKVNFKLEALGITDQIKIDIEEDNWEEAFVMLEELQEMLMEENPREYEEVYLEMIEKAISELSKAYVPDNIKKFAKTKGVTDTVNQIARWAEKAGKRIVGGTAIGKHYSTLILDLTFEGAEVSIDTDKNTIKVNGDPVTNYEGFEKALGSEKIYENYSRFKNETKTRPKADQFHQAIREVKKRVHEIHKVLEYVNRLKEDLTEDESGLKYRKHTEGAIAKIKEMVSELNHKIRKFK